ncbi:hypothetical protein ACO0RG_003106 [Hanseniaspora osmophila]|uniref:Uncharacterized protein n=1 Tax=Hanseniaspora osmophila TaxID=56408 RepID=A0A1E5RF64_9ASCO|nr:hypothetical protein AWRI3579_g1754 [Hanseniaspora osmophila]
MFRSRIFRAVSKRNVITPPTYFSSPAHSPNVPLHHVPPMRSGSQAEPQPRPRLLDISILFSVLSLSFFAVDNYRSRVELELELENFRLDSLNQKDFSKMELQGKFKKRELQILNERKNTQIKEMKMLLHIAMLKQQLEKNNIKDSITLQQVHEEFNKKIRMDNSLSNVSGVKLWIDSDVDSGKISADWTKRSKEDNARYNVDDSIKKYLPNEKEYEHLRDN